MNANSGQQSQCRRRHRPLTFALKVTVLALSLVASPLMAQRGPDILGLQLGMTQEQVLGVLEQLEPPLEVDVYTGNFTFNDGAQYQDTPEFLSFIYAKGELGTFFIKFSPLPGEERVISIARNTVLYPNLPTRAQLVEQVQGKYGKPVAENSTGTLNYYWVEEGKAACYDPKGGGVYATVPRMTTHQDTVDILNHLDLLAKRGNKLPEDRSQCGYILAAELDSMDPVRGLTTVISDIGGWAASEIKASEWVEQLQAEAEQARIQRGTGPRLLRRRHGQ